ncbi:MAG: winged helix DNA-binding protein [Pseudomonadota bacterium]
MKKVKQPRLDKHWHLATDDHEIELTELEFALIRVSEAFARWESDCLACCHSQVFSGADTAVLHVIRMHDRPKSISEIGRLLNRDDTSNLQYGVRKLARAGLIEKSGVADNKKGVTYKVSQAGLEATDKYGAFRRELLLPLTELIAGKEDLNAVARVLNLLAGMYDQASCIAATHRAHE